MENKFIIWDELEEDFIGIENSEELNKSTKTLEEYLGEEVSMDDFPSEGKQLIYTTYKAVTNCYYEVIHKKDEVSEEEWMSLCEQYKTDPEAANIVRIHIEDCQKKK